jgi:hypothetical protein
MTSNISALLHMPPEFFDPELTKPKNNACFYLHRTARQTPRIAVIITHAVIVYRCATWLK